MSWLPNFLRLTHIQHNGSSNKPHPYDLTRLPKARRSVRPLRGEPGDLTCELSATSGPSLALAVGICLCKYRYRSFIQLQRLLLPQPLRVL